MATTAYTPKDWNTGDIIAETDLDHIEQGVKAATKAVWQVTAVSGATFTVGAAAVRAAPAA